MIGFKDNYAVHNKINFINVTTYDIQTILSPHDVLNILKEGNERFLNDTRVHRSTQNDISLTASAQHPLAIVLACIDSRVPVETIFDMSFGDLFCVRVAGNIVNEDILASIEYACHVVGAKLIVVLGHTRCGAIKAACDGVKEGHITQLLDKIKPAVRLEQERHKNKDHPHFLAHVTALNIANTMVKIYSESPILNRLIDNEQVSMIGGIYHVESGKVAFDSYSAELKQIDLKKGMLISQKIKALIAPKQHKQDCNTEERC